MAEASALGARVRTLRRRRGLTQAQLAERAGISASYLNLIEHGRRPLPAALLIKLAEVLELDLRELSSEQDARSVADLLELFGDPIFDGAREAADNLASRVAEGTVAGLDSRLPTEEVSDLIQRHMNWFPELEEGAERLWRDARLHAGNLYEDLAAWLEREHGVRVRVEKTTAMAGAVRRYDR